MRTVRRRLFTPTRKAASLDDLNHALRAECLQWAKNQRHPVLKDQTVWSVFVSERPSLLTLPRAFDGYAERTVRVSSTSLVSFDLNRYSVDCKAAGRTAELRSYADKIVVMHGGECVAQHSRCFQRDQMIFDPWHYLPVLQKKPGALRNGAPFKDWDLPRSIHRTWQRLKHYPDWDRQLPDNPWVIPGRIKGTYMRNVNDPWKIIRARAGLEDVRLHDIRHSYASRALALGESLPMIGKLLGHTQVETTARYAHLARDSVHESAARIADSIAADILSEVSRPGPATTAA